VIGDAVNLGARLCSAAAPGQVILSEETRRAFRELPGVAIAPLPSISVKGEKDPIVIYSAVSAGRA